MSEPISEADRLFIAGYILGGFGSANPTADLDRYTLASVAYDRMEALVEEHITRCKTGVKNMAKPQKNYKFIVSELDRGDYVASYGIAGFQWTDNASVAYRFETYEEAEDIIEQEAPVGLYQINKVFIRD